MKLGFKFLNAGVVRFVMGWGRREGRRREGARPAFDVCTLPFSVAEMAPAKKGGEKKKGRSAINEVVTREYTINIHKRIHGV